MESKSSNSNDGSGGGEGMGDGGGGSGGRGGGSGGEGDSLFSRLQQSFPFFVMAGPNVIEAEKPERCVEIALEMKEICEKLDICYVFKTSYDKANRSSVESYRGPPFEQSLKLFERIKKLGIPIITDVHECWQVEKVAPYVDVLQIPAFLCRQTDLLLAAGNSGKIIHIKKGQFTNAETMHSAADKIRTTGNHQIILCERGNNWGYDDLIVDPRNLVKMRHPLREHLVSMDITHSLQQPGKGGNSGFGIGGSFGGVIASGGTRNLIPTIARMAVAVGVDGIFMEVHDAPSESPCDAPTQWPLDLTSALLTELVGLGRISLGRETQYVE